MTDIEVIWALKQLMEIGCENNGQRQIIINALDLINRQKAKYEDLLEQFRVLDCECERLEKANAKQKAEIERVTEENKNFADIGKMYSEIKAEAIKEFAKRLKQEVYTERGVPY